MDTKKLRQKILDLAIHGKLVPQDPNDEPASVLLERIKAEKEQLIKEGKIKRQKKSASSDTSHYGNDVPFEVPEGWVWCRLGDVFSHNTGKALNSSNKEGENLTYITTSNVYWDRFELNDLKKMPFTNSELEKCTVSKGDLLVCEGGDIGRSAIWNFDYDIRIQNHVHRLRPISEANVHFYYYVLMYNKQAGLIGGKGIGLMGLSSGELDKMIVPLPPIKEQCRITKEIEKLFAIVSLIEEDESDLKNAIQKSKSKILDLALSGHLTSDTSHYGKNEWKSVRISDICTAINGLWTGKKEPFVKVGVIRNANFTKDFNLDYSKIALIDVEVSSFAKRSLMAGDLIVEKSGGSDKYPVGRAILYEGPDNEYSFSNFTMVLRPKEVNIINSKYLYYSLMNRYLKGAMRTMQTQTTGLHNLILDKFMSQTIALPPIEEQVHIVENISHYFSILDSISSIC